jgi:hypothetical protein
MIRQEFDAGSVQHDLFALLVRKGSRTEEKGETLSLVTIPLTPSGRIRDGKISCKSADTELTDAQHAG